MFLEACMLGLFPLFMSIPHPIAFIAVSMFGHACYGVVLGLAAQRWALNWEDAL
jgi:hypothetical protein